MLLMNSMDIFVRVLFHKNVKFETLWFLFRGDFVFCFFFVLFVDYIVMQRCSPGINTSPKILPYDDIMKYSSDIFNKLETITKEKFD